MNKINKWKFCKQNKSLDISLSCLQHWWRIVVQFRLSQCLFESSQFLSKEHQTNTWIKSHISKTYNQTFEGILSFYNWRQISADALDITPNITNVLLLTLLANKIHWSWSIFIQNSNEMVFICCKLTCWHHCCFAWLTLDLFVLLLSITSKSDLICQKVCQKETKKWLIHWNHLKVIEKMLDTN